jgi:hypothetical protein
MSFVKGHGVAVRFSSLSVAFGWVKPEESMGNEVS